MKSTLFTLALCGFATLCSAEDKPVKNLRITQPLTASAPILVDTTDVWGSKWNQQKQLLDGTVSYNAWRNGTETNDSVFTADDRDAIRVAGFTLQNRNFAKATVKVKGIKEYRVFVDGKQGGTAELTPGRHEVAIKLLTEAGKQDTLHVSLESEQEIEINPTGKKPFSLDVLMNGERMGGVNLSPDGRFLVQDKSITHTDSKVDWTKYLIDLQTGNRTVISGFHQWCSTGHRYITRHTAGDMSSVYETVDALTGARQPLYTDYNNEHGRILPGEKLMMVNEQVRGPRENADVFQVLTPNDRQPGWRDRSNVALVDLATGQKTLITQGQHNVYGQLSPDGKKMLLSIHEDDITRRPFTFSTALVVDMETMQIDTLYTNEGFAAEIHWSPDSRSIAIQGSPEAFGGIGNKLSADKIPNMYDYDLFIMDVATHDVRCLTADFDPSISGTWQWNKVDGNIYALCENRDNQDIFRINPKTGKIDQLKLTERYVLRFALAEEKPLLAYYGQGASNSDRLYVVDLKSGKERLIEDLDAVRMGDVELGEFGEWNFQAERGDTIYGRYYLPPHFDPDKKYPMLVYYYGGCSPVGRYLDSYYCYHGWASMGYVVYVVQPSGCSGFGQEFASRHVNAYGDYTADDIIQGTKKFCEEHPFVNRDKIGCLGASYGGFMTQYLQTQTDIFAAAMSHAGISDPSSYWGYGYWGYSYSAVSAANSYPWTNRELFNDHAPLALADRVHTPILFMHGNADTNVPINESIQMFTALKILGRECAFVTVEGQNHHITDYQKRIKWQNTIYAWFQKWLKDDPTWWDNMYPSKNLK